MSGGFSAGGLITGLDSNNIIKQLMQIERQPQVRLRAQMDTLGKQRDAIRDLRTKMLALSNSARDFRFNSVFSQFQTASSDAKILSAEVSGQTPVIGSYAVHVTQLAGATVANSSAVLGGAINPNVVLNSSGMTTAISSGTFTVNGVQLTVDPATKTLTQLLTDITSSAAGVNATYDSVTDKVTFENKTAGDTRLINLGATGDTSNLLDAFNIKLATQSTGGTGATTTSSTRNLGAVDSSKALNQVSFAGGAVTAGTFLVNGVSITVDPTTDSLDDVMQRITDSDAQVSASYDSSSDRIRLVAKNLGSRTIGFTAGTSNFLTSTNLAAATQTAGNDAQFTVNGGAVQTRNTNEVADSIGGITLRLLSNGDSTVTVSGDDDKIVEDINKFLTAFNDAVDAVRSLVGQEGALRGDASVSSVEMTIREKVFSQITGITGDYSSLLDIGINTGSSFDSQAVPHLELDEDDFRAVSKTQQGLRAIAGQ